MTQFPHHTYTPVPPNGGRAPKPAKLRTLLAVLLIIVGLVLAPLSIVAVRTKTLITDTDTFVTAFSPLSQDPGIQQLIVDGVTDSILDSIDLSDSAWLQENVATLGIPEVLLHGVDKLEGALQKWFRDQISGLIEQAVQSEQFSGAWEITLKVTHSQFIGAMDGDPDKYLTLTQNGTVELQLGPVVTEIFKYLEDQGIKLGTNTPEVTAAVPLFKLSDPDRTQSYYSALNLAGTWLPWLAAGALIVGLMVANRRRRALGVTALALAIVFALLPVAISLGRTRLIELLGNSGMSGSIAAQVYDSAVHSMDRTSLIISAGAVALALMALIFRSRKPKQVLAGNPNSTVLG